MSYKIGTSDEVHIKFLFWMIKARNYVGILHPMVYFLNEKQGIINQ